MLFPLILALTGNFAATPQLAVTRMFLDVHEHVTIVKTNAVGRYATVLARGGKLESSRIDEPILVERFAFGWQALDLLNHPLCSAEHGISARVGALLLAGMPKHYEDSCRSDFDVGPTADVEAIRLQMRGPLVPSVVVWKNFGMGEWFGGGGGQSVYEKRGIHWKLVDSGGGAFGIHEMRSLGVPQAAWCPLGIYDAKCARKR